MSSPTPATEKLYWPPERMQQFQLEKLRETLVRAGRSSFYSSRLDGFRLEFLDDLQKLPRTSKEEARSASPHGLVAVPPEDLCHYHESFGTTGTPTSSWLTRDDLQAFAAQINQGGVDFRPGDRVLIRFPYAISMPAHIVSQAVREQGACVIPAGARTAISPYPRVIQLLKKLQATVLCCLPTEAIWLAETARLLGHDSQKDFPHLRAICTAGELMSDARRARIAGLWNVSVYNLYGCTEAGNMAADCSQGRLHWSWDHHLLEVLDPKTGQPVPAGGLGLAVVTTLQRQAMPLIRYELGDYVRLHTDHGCPCGRQAPVLEHYGRDLNRFEFAGKTWFVRDLEERLLVAPREAIGDLWLIEVGTDTVRFRVEAVRPDPTLYFRLEKQMQADLGLPLKIDPVPQGELMNRSRLLHTEPVGKPRVVGFGPGKLTIDDLMRVS